MKAVLLSAVVTAALMSAGMAQASGYLQAKRE